VTSERNKFEYEKTEWVQYLSTVKTAMKLSFISSEKKIKQKSQIFFFDFRLFCVEAILRLSVGQSLQNCCCYRRTVAFSFFFRPFCRFMDVSKKKREREREREREGEPFPIPLSVFHHRKPVTRTHTHSHAFCFGAC
jgi:hypothetical protein